MAFWFIVSFFLFFFNSEAKKNDDKQVFAFH